MNYLGDWGFQFGLLGAGFQRFGSQEKLKENPLQHLFDVYVQVHREAEGEECIHQAARDFFRALEQGEEEPLSLWRHFREITVAEYQRVYNRLGVRFDEYSGESFHQDQVLDVLEQLRTRGLLKSTEKGTSVVDLSPAQDMSYYSTVLRSDGTSLYITRDLAAAVSRKEQHAFDEMIYVTDKSQAGHFRQVFEILRAMGYRWAQSCRHVPFGLVQGMKTRKGEVVFLVDVLDEARSKMLRNMRESTTTKHLEDPEDTAEKVGIAALIVQDFKGPLESDYKFDWDRVLQSPHGLENTALENLDAAFIGQVKMMCQLCPLPLFRYDEVLWQISQDLQPRYLVNFLMILRLQLFSSAHTVLASGMRILGITPVQKM
uniref:Probable arginine--tRNA ligase, mitochondrial n=1 Tax=Scleropages formosus TaxID=113540 RepID=A0A8C9SEU5_SCLFO